MREGYGTRFVCVCKHVSVTVLAATYLVNIIIIMSKVRQYTVSCRLLKIHIVWTLLKTFRLGDMVSFACHDDQ